MICTWKKEAIAHIGCLLFIGILVLSSEEIKRITLEPLMHSYILFHVLENIKCCKGGWQNTYFFFLSSQHVD
jgi:hypothetical protein